MKSSRANKKPHKIYKALILDVDGTIMQNNRDAMPSEKTTVALRKASKIVHICLATSRPYNYVHHILDQLKLSGFIITLGGAQIIDITTKRVIWEKEIEQKDAKTVCAILKKIIDTPFWLSDGNKVLFVPPNKIPKKVLQIYVTAKLTEGFADECIKKISHIATITAHKVPSWNKGYYDILVGHALATKQHGIFEVAKLLDIQTHDMIGVGDGYNDFPLLMACGLKVAMGNADAGLKAIADYIAPSAEQDGVVDIINKFVL